MPGFYKQQCKICGQKYKSNVSSCGWFGFYLRRSIKKREYSQQHFFIYYCFLVLFLVHFSALFDFSMFTIFAFIIKSFRWRINIINVDVTIVKMLCLETVPSFRLSVGRSPIMFCRRRKTCDSVRPGKWNKNWELDKWIIIWNA